MLFLGNKTCLGVDTGGRDIKIVELRKVGRKYEVLQAVRIPVSSDSSSSNAASAIAAWLAETRTSASKMVCSLPSHMCSVKFAQVPKAKRGDLARIARFEAESQIPLPIGDLAWGFATEDDSSDSTCRMVIAGARRSSVEDSLKSLESACIQPAGMTPSCLAAARAVSLGRYDEAVLLVDIGAEWTDLCILEGGCVRGVRSVRLGGDELIQAFSEDFHVDQQEAERLMRIQGLVPNVEPPADDGGSDASQIQTWLRNLSEEIRRSLLSLGGERPGKVVLVGGSAGLPGIDRALAANTGLPVQIGDPWNGMSLSEVCSYTLRESSAGFAVATGLALTGLDGRSFINLMPRHIADDRLRRRREVALLGGMGAAALALFVWSIVGASGLRERSQELDIQRSQVAKVRADIRRAGPDLRPSAALVSQTVQDIEKKETGCLELLRELSENLPRSVWLTELSFESGKSVVLKGGSLSNAAVADAVDMISLLGLFDSVALEYSNLARGEGSQGYEFQITCKVPGTKAGASKAPPGERSGTDIKTGIVVQ